MLAPKRKGGKRKGSSVLRGREQKNNLLFSLALPGPFPSSAPGAKARKKKRNGKAQAARDSLFPATAYSVLSRVFISVGGREVEGAGAAAREARLWQTTDEMEPRRFSLSLFPDGRRTIPPRLCKLRKRGAAEGRRAFGAAAADEETLSNSGRRNKEPYRAEETEWRRRRKRATDRGGPRRTKATL